MPFPELDKDYQHPVVEKKCQDFWEKERVYRYDPSSEKEIFSVDTPPPYVSAAHLHVGHAASYSQAEFVIRYQRMKGKNIFYPMGFDDNGLPTERYVEQTHKVNKKTISRADFRKLCLEETKKGGKVYENLWRSMGLSVDWSLFYSTIDEHCRRTSQKSFIDLYQKGRMYRSNEPVLWDTHFETALAQADLDTISRKGTLYDVAFSSPDGQDLIISTTRPELLCACVALYCHPEDSRYQFLIGKTAIVPLFNYEVPIKTSTDVDPEFGTGLMMVCTFGDGEDVKKWKLDQLQTRLCLTSDGKLNDLAGPYAGLPTQEAKSKVAKDLEEKGFLRGKKTVDQNVSVAERSGTPVEFQMIPQWFIKILDLKEDFLKRGAEINWHPDFMKVRLETWINGLKYDWNISRQRFYGVPFPVWYCKECGEVVLPLEDHLPVDPLEEACPVSVCSKCGAKEFIPEADVMDTWMTSSLTPLINANWVKTSNSFGNGKVYPMSIRVQAHEIIRTWLFYTLIKSHLHTNSLPWKDVMISGWGLSEQGKKISKRDLESLTDKDGFNRYNPDSVIEKYGADALRFWAAGSHLGYDFRYQEKDVKAGRKLVVKLWNAARFCLMQLEGFDPKAERMPIQERTVEDRWLYQELYHVVEKATKAFDQYDYATARDVLEKFFWMTFCDNYLEIVKDRFWNKERYDDTYRRSAQETLWEVLRILLSLFAPFVPFVTEEIYQQIYRSFEPYTSLHISSWPVADSSWQTDVSDMKVLLAVLNTVRQLRTQRQISQGKQLLSLTIDVSKAETSLQETVKKMESALQAVARVEKVLYQSVSEGLSCEGFPLTINFQEA